MSEPPPPPEAARSPQPALNSGAGPASGRGRALKRWGDQASGVIVSTSCAAVVILLADRLYRPEWDFSWADHWMGAPILYLAPAALIGLLWAQFQFVQHGLSQRFRARPRRRDWIRAAMVAMVAALASLPVAFATFSGAKISRSWLSDVGPPLFITAVFAGAFGSALILWRVQRRSALGRYALGSLVAFVYFLAGCGALYVDMNVYVGLYTHLHTFLEFVAFALLVGAFQIAGFIFIRKTAWATKLSRATAISLVALGVLFVTYRPLRTWTDAHLAHAWVDEIYVGRTLRRAQLMELQLTGGSTLRVARIAHLKRHFGVQDDRLDPRWMDAVKWEKASPQVRNLLFFYVDTLRADAANDAGLMPHLARLRAESIDFRRAYAAGSDTLRSLPTITRGNYFLDKIHGGDLLRLARDKGIHTRLIVAQSASEFLQKLLPTFSFDQRTEIADYEVGRDVWGYGADRATAPGVGDATVAFLQSRQAQKPFLLWAFHFDAHAWREINDSTVDSLVDEYDLKPDIGLNLRYRAMARSIDFQLGRTLRALRATGHDKDTALVFISDHGEGLGQGGFWVHSIFLWESLIHVPLVLKIPGVPPRKIDEPVSLVDVAPTLAPLFGKGEAVYHGENLLNPEREEGSRRLPILLRAGEFQGHDRVGLVDPKSRRKLVLRLEAVFPELIAYETDPLDENNLARQEENRVRSMVHTIARSPIFPRREEDFMLHSHPDELGDSSAVARTP